MAHHASRETDPLPPTLDALCVGVVRADSDERRELVAIRRMEAETKLAVARADALQAAINERREKVAADAQAAPKAAAAAAPNAKKAPPAAGKP